MLPQAALVRAKTAIESLYDASCDVIEHRKVTRADHTTGFEDVTVHKDVPCRLSFSSIPTTSPDDNMASSLNQTTKLFASPEVAIAPGSKIVVTQAGKTVEYRSSGQPTAHATHQEINLEIFKGWS